MTVEEDDIFICHHCIGDSFLKNEVKTEGTRATCHYCGKRRRSISLADLAERIHNAMETYYALTPDAPGTEGYMIDPEIGWERRGEPVQYVIAEIAGLDENIASDVVEQLSEEHGYDAFEGGYENPYGFEACYEERRVDDFNLRDTWAAFRSEIRSRARFFSPHARDFLNEIFGDVSTFRTWDNVPAVREIQPTDDNRFVYRGRVAYSSNEIERFLTNPVRELGPPPSRSAMAGRMNASGISVFYGAQDSETCVAEIRAPVGSHVVIGRFEIIRPLRLLDFDVLTRVVVEGSVFDPEYGERLSRAAFLRHVVDEISRPVMPRDEEFEYLPTQAVAEYLAECISPRVDGIVFRSSQTNGEGHNIVLFNHSRRVEPYVLPEGSEVTVNMGWATEDDYYDDSISVTETIPNEETENGEEDDDNDLPLLHGLYIPNLEADDFDIPHDPTLRLDVESIDILRIQAVTYNSSQRHVSRYRRNRTDRPPF